MNMTNKQLFEAIEEDCLKRKCYDNYLVRVRYKYKCETKWIYSNEYLEFNNGDWLWLNDWNEGQEDVEFLGFIAVDDIYVPVKAVFGWQGFAEKNNVRLIDVDAIDADTLANFIDHGHLNNPDAKVFSENDILDLINKFQSHTKEM